MQLFWNNRYYISILNADALVLPNKGSSTHNTDKRN